MGIFIMSEEPFDIKKLFNIENIKIKDFPEELIKEIKPYVSFLLTQAEELIKIKEDENIAKTLLHYYSLAEKLKIKKRFNFPIKFGIPAFEKIALEEDSDLQKEWAKLLVVANSDYHPIYGQYAEILSQINSENTQLIKKTYAKHKEEGGFNSLENFEYVTFKPIYNKAMQEAKEKEKCKLEGKSFIEQDAPDRVPKASCPIAKLPYIINGTVEDLNPTFEARGGTLPSFDYTMDLFKKSSKILDSLVLLKKLNLLNFEFCSYRDSGRKGIVPQWGIMLTPFGYKFAETLEKAEIPN